MIFSITRAAIILSLSFTIISCTRTSTVSQPKPQDDRFLILKKELEVVGEYGLMDTNLFSRSLMCVYPSTTTTILMRICELKDDTCSSMLLAFVRYSPIDAHNKKDKSKLPFLVVKNLRRINKAQSDKVFSFCDDYVRAHIFYQWGHPFEKVMPGEYTIEEGDRIVYTKRDSVYEYCYYDYPRPNEIEKFYALVNDVCKIKGMANDMKFPWIDDKGYLNEKWTIVGGK